MHYSLLCKYFNPLLVALVHKRAFKFILPVIKLNLCTNRGTLPSIMDNLKMKLKNVLYCDQFCGICMEKDANNMAGCNEILEISAELWTETVTLKDIVQEVFFDVENILTSGQICNICMEKLLKSYIFINNTKQTLKIIMKYVNEVDFKSIYLNKHLSESKETESSNFVNVLNTDYFCNGLTSQDDDNIFNHQDSPKKLLENVTTPNKELNNKVGISKLKENKTLQCKICYKSFKKQHLNCHYKVHSTIECNICHHSIADDDLVNSLKTNHEDATYCCSICSVASNSNALPSQETTCHKTDIPNPQCVMCLNFFSNEQFKLHNCKFNCPECYKMPCIHYKYLMFYREQILNHASRAKCLDCDYVCRKKEILLGHVNREHLDHNPYSCDKCGRQFHSKPHLKAHIYRFHHDCYICEYCDSEFNSKLSIQRHRQSCELIIREFICDKCPASFNIMEELMVHKKRRHTELFPCGSCNMTFLKDSKRKEHFVKVHKRLQVKNKSLKMECTVCEERFETKGKLARHMGSHGPGVKHTCRICNIEYETLRKLRAHSRKHKGPFVTCSFCRKKVRQILLQKHLTSHVGTVVTCKRCGKSFQSTALLKYHEKIHLNNVPCPKCKKLINPAKLRRHFRGHIINEDPLLKDKRKQKPHMKCEICGYVTWNNILLEGHMNRHHLKIKPYVCHICSKNFIGKHLLKKHLETHTTNKSITCMVCGKKMANPTCLKMHLRLHTGEKPYSCDVCGESFRSSSIMNVHKLKKHSAKSTKCPLCINKFHTVRDLRRHVIKVHWKRKHKFDPREVEGLENYYHLFHDGRRVKVDEKEIDFYMPCQ